MNFDAFDFGPLVISNDLFLNGDLMHSVLITPHSLLGIKVFITIESCNVEPMRAITICTGLHRSVLIGQPGYNCALISLGQVTSNSLRCTL